MSETESKNDVEVFRLRARAWLEENMPPERAEPWSHADAARWPRARELQRLLFDGGFAGICFPKAYGGQGLSLAHQQAFDEEVTPYEMPLTLNVPTFGIIAATLLEFGTEEQKKRYLPAILNGDEAWVQLLSEPTGGSDLASVMTRATPEADGFVLSGSKVWSSGAYAADYGICVARTNWDLPKHDGISVLIVKMDQPGVAVERIRGVAGDDEFCQEFFDDVWIPAANVLGEIDAGWTVVRGLLVHERNSMGGASPYVSGGGLMPLSRRDEIVALAQRLELTGEPRVRELVAEAHVLSLVQDQTSQRVTDAMMRGKLGPPAGAILRLMGARVSVRRSDIALEISGADTGVWEASNPEGGVVGKRFLARQGSELGGGSTEIQRNIISERLLEMPREPAADRGVPFSQVRRNAMPSKPRG
ncbi:MAG: acyl-CoA dehydrogenase [bacterium]|nr:acyl-CoA dehydrogenase [Deltaproteobacteria bacterium]MCP4908949.1 acyl-CoA dehydrogenase [bacterium]